jgi:RNA recognition motif-containing protein
MARLYVGNLPHGATDSTLGDFVSQAGFGVTSAVVIVDKLTGQSRGFGFVELTSGDDLQQAIGSLNGRDFEGRTLRVNEARPQRGGFSRQHDTPERGRFARRRAY